MNTSLRFYVQCICLVFITYSQTVFAQESPDPDSIIACSADTLVAKPDASVQLKVLIKPKLLYPVTYLWGAEKGHIEGKDATVIWNLKNVPWGKAYTAKVQITDSSGKQSNCNFRLIVRSPPVSIKYPGRKTGRAFLFPDEKEKRGYGLYSYLLLGTQPDDEQARARYLETIYTYLRLSDMRKLERYIDNKKMLNITYLPIRNRPVDSVIDALHTNSEKKLYTAANWVLDNYDYARASALLLKLGGDTLHGPYFISSLTPINNHNTGADILFQDQSLVPARITSLWVKEFLYQSQQENYWEVSTLRQLTLKLRTTISIIAESQGVVTKAIKKWISLKKIMTS